VGNQKHPSTEERGKKYSVNTQIICIRLTAILSKIRDTQRTCTFFKATPSANDDGRVHERKISAKNTRPMVVMVDLDNGLLKGSQNQLVMFFR